MKSSHCAAFLSVVLLLFLATPAFAENKMGFRLTLGSAPGVDQLLIVDSVGATYFDDAIDPGTHMNLYPAFVFRSDIEKPIGFVGMAGIFIRHHAGEHQASGTEAQLTAFGVNLSPGMAIRLGEKSHLELRVELGFGSAVHDIGGTAIDFEAGSGSYSSYGASAGIYFDVSRVVVLGIDVGYLNFDSDGEVDDFFDIYDTDMSGAGTTANVSIGFMF